MIRQFACLSFLQMWLRLASVVASLFLSLTVQAAQPSHGPTALDVAALQSSAQEEISIGARGAGVARAQILLDRAHFSCGAIDGEFGSNLQKTVLAYQNDRQLPATGTLDTATWNSLNADSAPLLIAYTITAGDEDGPFVQIPKDLMKQAALPALGYTSPLEELSERVHSSRALVESLNPGADFTHVGQQLNLPNVITMPPGEAGNVTISKSESSVRVYGDNGKLLAFYITTIGSEHDPLPLGTWKITGVKRNPEFHYDARLFWDATNKNDKAVIQPGPNNPVGLVWIDLSKEHYGIHGTPDPALVGHAFSHGCVRLTNWDALELASMVKPGTPAILKE